MKEQLMVERRNISMPIIDKNGNVNKKNCVFKYHLVNKGVAITKDYNSIAHLFDDFYTVLDVVSFSTAYRGIQSFPNWGIICLKRDKNNRIIPLAEDLVVPFLYYDIYNNDLKTATACVDEDHFTYIDLDKTSPYYGEQLVPAVLTSVTPFNATYKGYAECGIDDVKGYIPRDIKPITKITRNDLLTKEQVECLIRCSNVIDEISKVPKETNTLKLERIPKK